MSKENRDADFDDEIEAHLELLTRRFIDQGMTAEEGRAAARRQFGSTLRLKEDRHRLRAFTAIETFWQDVRFAGRMLRRNPGFTAVAVATLALGLGVNAAIFSVVKTVLLEPLPYRASDRLVMISEDASNAWENSELDYTTAAAFEARTQSLESIAAYRHINTILLDDRRGEMVVGLAVTHNFFDTLGIHMQLGRNFLAVEDRPPQRRVVILTDALWTQHFHADPTVIGRVLDSQGGPLTIVGVLPRAFEPLIKGTTELEPEMYLPLAADEHARCLTCQGVRIVARLKPGATGEGARADLDTVSRSAGPQPSRGAPP